MQVRVGTGSTNGSSSTNSSFATIVQLAVVEVAATLGRAGGSGGGGGQWNNTRYYGGAGESTAKFHEGFLEAVLLLYNTHLAAVVEVQDQKRWIRW